MLKQNESLARYTSWRIGGAAKQLYKPENLQALQHFLQALPKEETVVYLGLGSNTLIREGGINATVIILQGVISELARDRDVVKAGAGVSCAQFARFCARQGLLGMEFLAGVPGTMGGALAMNAGAHGGETWNAVQKVAMLTRQGKIIERAPSEFGVHYRQVDKPIATEAFLYAWFALTPGNSETSLEKIRQYLAHRSETQPIDQPNGGSVFRNPPGNYAGKLIESCGLKGMKMGGASISEKHANFIVVDANIAQPSDVEKLVEFIENTVQEKCGIRLVREIHILGEPS